MGYKASPEILQIITLAIAGVTTVVHRLWAASPLVHIDVWIDNINITGSKSDATLWRAQVLCNADGRHATIGRTANRASRITPFWGCSLIILTPGGIPERKVCPFCTRHAGAQSFNHRGNGGNGVTLFVRGGHFGHALM
ncbi:target of rapamycin (TOR) kinase 1 [Trypanosoma cruzi]|nr:target of rapamycin (TOR) kinase 1 [Trypanosoma cruzi]